MTLKIENINISEKQNSLTSIYSFYINNIFENLVSNFFIIVLFIYLGSDSQFAIIVSLSNESFFCKSNYMLIFFKHI